MLRRLLMTAAAGVLVVSLAITHEGRRFSPRDLPHDFSSPGLALQFATRPEDGARIVGDREPEHADRRLMRSQIAKDWALIFFSGWSVGTHWMMQERITVCPEPRCRAPIVLGGDDVQKVLRALDQPSLAAGDSANAKQVHALILRDEQELKPSCDRLSACLGAAKGTC